MFKGLPTSLFISEAPPGVQEGAYLATIPGGIKSKQELGLIYMKELRFPDYFNPGSWDSFDECLRALDNIQERSVLIAHEDLPLITERKDLLIYLDILHYCAAFNTAYTGRSVVVTFPPNVREKVVEMYGEIRQKEISEWVTPYDISAFTFIDPHDGICIPEDCDLLVEIPPGIQTRQELIAAFPHSINPWLLPEAKSWMALKEVLGGIRAQLKHVCLVHKDLPLENKEELKCYLDVLLTVRDIHERSGCTKFDAFFPTCSEEQLCQCVFELRIEREQWRNVADLRAGIL